MASKPLFSHLKKIPRPSQIADETIVAGYEDEAALSKFAEKVDVISYEFENIPLETVWYLQNLKPVYPDDKLLEVTQDRIKEKTYLNDIGIPTAKWVSIRSVSDINDTIKRWNNNSLIIKTTRLGYDGKGQTFLREGDDFQNAIDQFKPHALIGEQVIDFECEISVIVARDIDGNMETYGPVLNEHRNHILHKTTAPAPIDDTIAQKAIALTKTLAEKVNLRGVLALELFLTKDGQILANEIAPRTHNSGHWTIDACDASQFDNHIRTVCALPVAPPNQHTPATMINLIGDDVSDLTEYEVTPDAHIHLYGKTNVKPGRKMGHVTVLNK